MRVEAEPVFTRATWGIHVADLATGEVLIDQAGGKSLVPASVMKIYSLATALDSYGADYRFRTPVYVVGEVKDGVLAGDLVLVASGDFSFGLREQADGTLAFNSLPEVDHNSTYTGFPGGAHIKNSNPLSALDALATQVKAAGIGEITGDVLIDDRLFETYRGFSAGAIAPIWVNENVIDITVTPAKGRREAENRMASEERGHHRRERCHHGCRPGRAADGDNAKLGRGPCGRGISLRTAPRS